MDIYVLDDNFLKVPPVVDEFSSVIWTERYNDSSDVQLTFPDTSPLKSRLVEDVFLWIPDSQEVMLVESAETQEGVRTVIGHSLDDFLKQRMLRRSWRDTTDAWVMGPAPASSLMNLIMAQMCQTGGYINDGSVLGVTQGANEIIPKLTLADPISGPNIQASVNYGTVFDGVKGISDLDDLGFRMYPPDITDGTGNLLFETYRGNDRSSSQSIYPPVIFEPALDSLADEHELRSKAGYKNVVWVFPSGATSQDQVVGVFAPGAEGLTGFKRRTLMLEATDVNVADYVGNPDGLAAVLTQTGRNELINNNYVRLVDGQLVPQLAFTYGKDYFLGDIIELRGSDGTSSKARITEYIRSQDSNGQSAYPTLSAID